ITPLYQAQTDWTFDGETYGDKAVVLRLDNSANALTIRTDNKHVTAGEGRNIEAVGENTPWGTDMNPVLRAPEKRGQ
ncbi:MAG: hypothetical protein JWO82_1958, partial [Akkermansiaceae bacterium]|nr:hypothetical protein [Akkermansiaceae bacterium]